MQIFEVLRKDTRILDQKGFLQASAGTGKTFAIEHIVVRLLLESIDKGDIELSQILIVTFTKKATYDLRLRIRKNIEKALNILKNKKHDSELEYLQLYYHAPSKAIKILKQALLLFSEAQIFTIHGYCFSALAENAFEAGGDLFLQDEPDLLTYKNAIEDFLLYHVNPDRLSYSEISLLIDMHLGISTLIDKLSASININSCELKEPVFIDFINMFNKALKIFPTFDDNIKNKILSDFDKIKVNYKKIKGDLKHQLPILAQACIDKKISYESLNKLIIEKGTIFSFLHETNKKKRGYKKIDIETKSFFDLLAGDIFLFFKDIVDKNRIFSVAVSEIASFIREKEKNGESFFSFDNLLTKMLEALKNESFLNRQKAKYKAVIVDEFQDTDPHQWEIFYNLYLKGPNALKSFFIVGDPKQSIYSFRKADLNTFFKAGDVLGKRSHYFLNTNYRSNPKLLAAINYFFSNSFVRDWLYITDNKQIIKKQSFVSVLPGLKTNELVDENHPFHFFVASEQKASSISTLPRSAERKFLTFIVNKIKSICISRKNNFRKGNKKRSQKEHRFNNFSILVKDKYQAMRARNFLMEHTIPSNTQLHYLLTHTSAYDSIKNIINLLVSPKDINNIKIVFGGPFFGYNFELMQKEDWSEEISFFCICNEIFLKYGLSHFFSYFQKSIWKEEKIIEKIVSFEDLSFYQNFNQLVEIFIEEESKYKFSSVTILTFLKRLDIATEKEDPRLLIHPMEDENAVKIMTTHASKGLEFDIVFALGLINRVKDDSKSSSCNLELIRQLYVAFTRAKNKLFIPLVIYDDYSSLKLNNISPLELFFTFSKEYDCKSSNLSRCFLLKLLDDLAKKGHCYYEHIDNIAIDNNLILEDIEENQNDQLQEPKTIKIEQKQGQYLSFSSLHHSKVKKADRSKTTSNGKEIVLSHDILKPGAETGVLIHKILETIFSLGKKEFYEIDFIRKIVNENIKNTDFIDHSEMISKAIEQLLLTKLPGSNFCLREIDVSNVFVEPEFLFNFEEKNLLKGFIDMIFKYGDKYYLLDWKTNWLGDMYKNYERSSLEIEMAKNDYFLQAAIYTQALKNFLKFIDPRPFDEIFGGAYYVFIRGVSKSAGGFYFFSPDLTLIDGESYDR